MGCLSLPEGYVFFSLITADFNVLSTQVSDTGPMVLWLMNVTTFQSENIKCGNPSFLVAFNDSHYYFTHFELSQLHVSGWGKGERHHLASTHMQNMFFTCG